MRDRVLVAVITPAYNAERYLADAVRSALAQTLRDLCVVIVDDGSADGPLAVARALAGGDPRVTVLASPNSGPAPARNLAWRSAPPSAYLAFLDADDLWDADKLAAQVAYLEEHPDAVGVGGYMRYVSSGGRVLGRAGEQVGEAEQARIERGALAPFPTSSFVVRREAFEAVGGFDESFGELGSEDLDLFARLALVGRIGTLPRELGSYRVHPTSMMARDRLRINAAGRFVQQRLAARAAGRDLTLEEFWRGYRPGWRERRQDRVEVLYRSAALWYAERRPLRAVGYGILALLAAPTYTVPRLIRQRLGGGL
jgi:glycosyltransferase involved in cell wall biosynthesis